MIGFLNREVQRGKEAEVKENKRENKVLQRRKTKKENTGEEQRGKRSHKREENKVREDPRAVGMAVFQEGHETDLEPAGPTHLVLCNS